VDRLVKTATMRPQYAPAKPAARKTKKRSVMKPRRKPGARASAKATAKTPRKRGSTAFRTRGK
jgi:hypothetical protein